MTNIRAIIRKGYIVLAITFMAVAPIGSLANVSADATCTPPVDSSYGAGVHHPTGAEAAAFTYQCDNSNGYVGDWLSARYVYDPAANTKQPIDPVIYYYDSSTGNYDYTYWAYVTTTNSYTSVDASTATPPAGAQTVGAPAPQPASPPPSDDSSSSDPSSAGPSAKSSASTGGNNIDSTGNNNGTIDNNTGVNVTNVLTSTATSGNAMVLDNTHAGDATSGNAVTQADVTNMLQSSSNALGSGSNVATFTFTIDGDVTGDLFFNPDLINGVQGDASIDKTLNNNLVINNTSDATINNNLTLDSETGDATVANNTHAGSATSGNARSVANIVNSIRSAITSGKSFVGTINITGNLNGDILLPDNFVDTLIAANTPTVSVTAPGSTNSNNSTVNDTTTINNTNNQSIKNNVTSTAQTGTASVTSNANAGSAHSGNAKTNVTAFNLTGSQVVAKNSILVYVNVLGKWTGLIVNAPAGATAVQLGGNVTQNSTVNNNTTVNNTANQQINNDVNVKAKSGNATVDSNTNAGDATAGDAETAVNLVNIEDSSFDLSNWFGILYINVFGTWNGSFGINTSAGDIASQGTDSGFLVGNVGKLVHYAPVSHKTTVASTGSGSSSGTSIDNGTVLAAQTTIASTAPIAPKLVTPKASASSNLWLPAIGVILGLAILGSERLFNRRPA